MALVAPGGQRSSGISCVCLSSCFSNEFGELWDIVQFLASSKAFFSLPLEGFCLYSFGYIGWKCATVRGWAEFNHSEGAFKGTFVLHCTISGLYYILSFQWKKKKRMKKKLLVQKLKLCDELSLL